MVCYYHINSGGCFKLSVTKTKVTRKKNAQHTVNLTTFFDKSEISVVKSYINIFLRMCYYQSIHDRDTRKTIYSLFIFGGDCNKKIEAEWGLQQKNIQFS